MDIGGNFKRLHLEISSFAYMLRGKSTKKNSIAVKLLTYGFHDGRKKDNNQHRWEYTLLFSRDYAETGNQ
ncbi:MAG: hypothetical protein H9789_01260 [Candidatus Paraprevotella stercoravium]|uniref:Uncharacterized protein n=1 Tax=Candidatus Paraprevotella stercoravium TaxID=2838725 RepID=A0A9E2P0G7_9BACT|nr:hypothetical protein [Candidatus Paraprevotella stercoravium]